MESHVGLIVNSECGSSGTCVEGSILYLNSEFFRRMENFRRMLQHGELERQVHIENSTLETLYKVLAFFRTGKISETNFTEAVSILSFCEEFELSIKLKDQVAEMLSQQLNLGNACHTYEIAKKYSLRILEKTSMELLIDLAFAWFDQGCYRQASKETILKMIEFSQLNMQEEKVIEMIWKWAKHQCLLRGIELTVQNIRAQFDESFIKEIRYSKALRKKCCEEIPKSLLDEMKVTKVMRARHHLYWEKAMPYRKEYSKIELTGQESFCVCQKVLFTIKSTIKCLVFSTTVDVYLTGISLAIVFLNAGKQSNYFNLASVLIHDQDIKASLLKSIKPIECRSKEMDFQFISHTNVSRLWSIEFSYPYLVKKNIVKCINILYNSPLAGFFEIQEPSLPYISVKSMSVSQDDITVLIHRETVHGIKNLFMMRCYNN